MSNDAIRVERLSKRYRLGGQRAAYGTLRDTIMSAVQAPLRALRRHGGADDTRELWALDDVSFEVKQGEVLGIIGRNGAGKSTLLKILSRVTKPTTGRALIHGRVGSLLEVGTGFHPELTGRENIYLNGAILGMTKQEMRRKFDEVVEFADVARFLDTPVKRYSSGMYMRLAFSIAAHLEPEILIVDEVLAVGDAAFQKKCLGKMNTVARQGRTVVFVSHNMPSILSLCDRVLLFDTGKLIDQGPAATVVQQYLEAQSVEEIIPLDQRQDRQGDGSVRFVGLQVESADGDGAIRSGSRLKLVIHYRGDKPVRYPQFVVSIYDPRDFGIFLLHNELVGGLPESLPPEGKVTCVTDPIQLTPGRCVIHLELLKGNVRADYIPDAAYFEVEADDFYGSGMMPPRDWVLSLLGQRWQLDGDIV